MADRAFVYVTCGDYRYLEELNLSVKLLKKCTSHPIIVITDGKRNNGLIAHDNVLDIPAPDHLNNHQAAIYLKTRLPGILKGKVDLACYLDSDVFAVSPEVDQIFDYFQPPVTFAHDNISPDHNISLFSEFAIRSPLLESYRLYHKLLKEGAIERFYAEMNAIDYSDLEFTGHFKNGKFYEGYAFKRRPDGQLWFLQQYRNFKLIVTWFFLENTPLIFYVNAITGENYWIDNRGYVIHDNNIQSNFLISFIHRKFKIRVENPIWHHWNGGVILFNKSAAAFFNNWHEMTMAIFKDPLWLTRDQGTLAATVWKMQLQNHPTLPDTMNYIFDPASTVKSYAGGFQFLEQNQTIKPALIHFLNAWESQQHPLFLDLRHAAGFPVPRKMKAGN